MTQADSIKVSVLVPIYNVERFLPECLESLMAQTLQEAEFICINDGSTDSSRQILGEFAARDARFRIIDKPNSGYGASMNMGLASACGEYIGIVESDDFVDANCFADLYAIAKEHGDLDIVKADHYLLFSDGRQQRKDNYPADVCGRVITRGDDGWASLVISTPAIWAAIYRRDFLVRENIGFLESPGASYQDTGFVFKSWIAASSVYVLDGAYLHYRTLNEGSSSASAGKAYYVCDEFTSIDDFLLDHAERAEELWPILAAKRFQTYWWNLKRISADARWAFAERAAGEFRVLDEQGIWDESLLKKSERKRLAKWLADPKGLVLDVNIDEAAKAGARNEKLLRLQRKVHRLRMR